MRALFKLISPCYIMLDTDSWSLASSTANLQGTVLCLPLHLPREKDECLPVDEARPRNLWVGDRNSLVLYLQAVPTSDDCLVHEEDSGTLTPIY